MTIAEQRQQAIDECRTWIGTPYLLGRALKGVGADCGSMLIETFIVIGKLERAEIEKVMHELFPHLSPDWYAHTSEERYRVVMARFVKNVLEARAYANVKIAPASIVITKACGRSKRFNHGGLVVNWPKIIHAPGAPVVECDASRDPLWRNQEIEVYDFWGDDAG